MKKSLIKNLFFILGSLTVVFFLLFIFTPSTFVLSYPIHNWGSTRAVFFNPEISKLILESLVFSFKVAFLVTILDILLGLPVAWVLARYNFRGKSIIETLLKLPLSVPTSALGFSVVLFWTQTEIFRSPFLLVTLVHLAFSYPYIITSLTVVLTEANPAPEKAARTLGASILTAVRTITLPLVRKGVASGMILTFARSLSETGATIIALAAVGSSLQTAPVLIASWKKAASMPQFVAAAALISTILIVLSCVLFLLVKLFTAKTDIPLFFYPRIERFLSKKAIAKYKNFFFFPLAFLVVVLPSFFILTQFKLTPSFNSSLLFRSLLASFIIATATTIINLVCGLPMAFLITRGHFKRLASLLDALIDIPLIVPTSALGFSLALFWQSETLHFSYFLLITLAHLAFTYPYVVKPLVAALQEADLSCEEAARMLGADTFTVARTVTLPLIVPSLEAGAIMAFTRSLSETGATMAVAPAAITAPVYIVDLVTSGRTGQAAFASIILIMLAFFFFIISKEVTIKAKPRG